MPKIRPFGMHRARSISALVCSIVFVDLLAFGFVGPLVPLYVRDFGGNGRLAGLTVSAFAAASFISLPLLGRLSDRIGRRPVILASLAGNALGFLLLAFAVQRASLLLVFAARLFAGAVAGNVTTCQSVIGDACTGDERAKRVAQLSAALALGLIIGPGLGSLMQSYAAWLPPLAAAIVTALDLLAAILLLPETLPEQTAERRVEPARVPLTRNLVLVLSLHFLVFACMANLQALLPLFVEARLAWGVREVGALFAASAVLALVVQGGAMGSLGRALSPQRVVVIGAAFLAVGMALLSLAQSAFVLLTGLGLAGIGLGIATPTLTVLALAAAPRTGQGVVLGLAQSSAGLARAVGPLAGGALFDAGGAGAPFVGCAAAALVSCGLGGLFSRAPDEVEERGSAREQNEAGA
jgi:DHA1 family tetracycline resistance protein-like MFS transporter